MTAPTMRDIRDALAKVLGRDLDTIPRGASCL